MSINHFSTDLPETLWWPQQQPIMEPNSNSSSSSRQNKPNSPWPSHLFHHYHHQSWLNPYNNNPQESPSSMFLTQNPTFNFNLNREDDEDQDQEEQEHQKVQQEQEVQQRGQEDDQKEHMFEKPLTPSDVGKLNRLVIPKQYAEKYFPLGGDSSDKGLLLSFEDETGKCWRFRYSYWNSSQSYVLTKGWSRYVKEKQLDAGDVVLFERHRTDGDRLFIGWRRRGESSSSSSGGAMVQGNSGGVWSRGLYSAPSGLQPYLANVGTTSVPYQPDCLHAGSASQNQTIPPLGNSKRLRLFGVNLECQLDESEPSTPDGSSLSSQGPAYQQFYSQPAYSSDSHSHSHMVQVSSGLKEEVKQIGGSSMGNKHDQR